MLTDLGTGIKKLWRETSVAAARPFSYAAEDFTVPTRNCHISLNTAVAKCVQAQMKTGGNWRRIDDFSSDHLFHSHLLSRRLRESLHLPMI